MTCGGIPDRIRRRRPLSPNAAINSNETMREYKMIVLTELLRLTLQFAYKVSSIFTMLYIFWLFVS